MRKILPFIIGALLLAALATGWILRPTPVITQGTGELAFENEFLEGNGKMSYEKTREAAQKIINCYFNKAIQAQMEEGNRKYAEAVKTQEYPGKPPSERDLQCDVFDEHPIAEKLFNELRATLAAIPDNQIRVGEKKQPNTQAAEIKPCNFEAFDKGAKMIQPVAGADYFAQKRMDTINPTYAAYTVAHCYQLMYFKYLETHFANLNVVKQGITWDGTPRESITKIQTGTVLSDNEARYGEYLRERKKTEAAMEHAVQTVDTLSKTYPLHVRYAQLTEHSKEVRDQIRRFRVAMDQLVYKLINQTTPNN